MIKSRHHESRPDVIPLESQRWSELRDQFGSASAVAASLRRLASAPGDEAEWKDLWSRLYHQGDVTEASYAAVPHLVKLARESRETPWHAFALPAAIEAARLAHRAPTIPSDLEASYHESIRELGSLGLAHLSRPWDHVLGQAILASVAVSKGLGTLADAILELGPTDAAEFLEQRGEHGSF